jgi:hypothetical protein
MRYDLWDTGVGKYLGRYTDESEALATAKILIDHYGPAFADELSIGRVRDDGEILAPLSGRELVARIRERLGRDDDRRAPVTSSNKRTAQSGDAIAATGTRAARKAPRTG